jgi:hypothetical protein
MTRREVEDLLDALLGPRWRRWDGGLSLLLDEAVLAEDAEEAPA